MGESDGFVIPNESDWEVGDALLAQLGLNEDHMLVEDGVGGWTDGEERPECEFAKRGRTKGGCCGIWFKDCKCSKYSSC